MGMANIPKTRHTWEVYIAFELDGNIAGAFDIRGLHRRYIGSDQRTTNFLRRGYKA